MRQRTAIWDMILEKARHWEAFVVILCTRDARKDDEEGEMERADRRKWQNEKNSGIKLQ